MKITESAKKFNNKLKESLNTALVAAFSFLIALSWRDVISEYLKQLTLISPLQSQLFSAIIITIAGVVGILIITSLLHKE